MNHIKRLWGHYLTLLILIAILAHPISRIYQFFQNTFGQEVALIALSLTVMVAMIFIIRGAVHTHRLVRDLKHDLASENNSGQPSKHPMPLIAKLFKLDPSRPKKENLLTREAQGKIEFPPHFTFSNNRHRGKPPRFPKEDIRKAVIKWESRDPSTTALTLEQFLAQEFGSGADGLPLMATTTFYDWRRKILKEIESGKEDP